MILRDVVWSYTVNVLIVECCGGRFAWPSNISLVECPECGQRELWHEADPKGGIWDQPVMQNSVLHPEETPP